MILEFRTILK